MLSHVLLWHLSGFAPLTPADSFLLIHQCSWLFLVDCFITLLCFGLVVGPGAALFDYTRITLPFHWTDVFDGKGAVGESWIFFGVG